MKKALIYNPYLDTLGGGEFFTSSFGKYLIDNDYSLTIAWKNNQIFSSIKDRFAIDFGQYAKTDQTAFNLLSQHGNLLGKIRYTKSFDLVLWISDGSIPLLKAAKNILLFQAPFKNVNSNSLFNQIKLKFVDHSICYSNFVKKVIDKEFKIKSKVINPPLNPAFEDLRPVTKKNIILSVGRFDQIMNAKKQDILIKVFNNMLKTGLKGWKLVLAGGSLKHNKFLLKLRKSAYGLPVEIITNATFSTIKSLYQKSRIYWHAAGFNENLDFYPERAEHFGIVVVEAMACSLVPLVFNGGGLPEVVGRKSQFLWSNLKELIKKTLHYINTPEDYMKLSKEAKKLSLNFTNERFYSNLSELFR